MFRSPADFPHGGHRPRGSMTASVGTLVRRSAGSHAAWTLPRRPSSPGRARQQVRGVLAAWGLAATDTADGVELIVSELVTNAVVHTSTSSVRLRLSLTADGVLVTVFDEGPGPPGAPGKPDLEAACGEGGRGLFLIDQTATSWGVRRLAAGTVVWARLDGPTHRGAMTA